MKILSDQVVQTTFRSCSLMVLKHFGFGLVFILHFRFVSCTCTVFLREHAGVEISDGDVSNIINSIMSFERWMTDRFSATAVHRELPLLGIDDNGPVVSGTADLVLETEGVIWIIDHKSDQVDKPELAFNSYRPQLECYATLLRSMEHNVLGMGINWIRRGEVKLTAHSYG